MPEVGNVDLPEKLIRQGVTDMVRISDGRMSGTAAGTVILTRLARIDGGRYFGFGAER